MAATQQSHVSLASPSVRRLARQRDIDLPALAARLGKTYLNEGDIVSTPTHTAASMPDRDSLGPGEAVALTRLEKLAGANLLDSHQQIPTVTHHDAFDTGAMEAFRA